MNSNFVIVIEADNKRAHAAYLKGLVNLDVIWPQIVEYATRRDADTVAELQRREAKMQAEAAARKIERDAAGEKFDAAMKDWRDWRPSFWSDSVRPFQPVMPLIFFDLPDTASILDLMCARRTHWADYFESILRELQGMADLAGVAIGPYRMTEHQVKAMIAWEDGSRIDSIKAQISGSTA